MPNAKTLSQLKDGESGLITDMSGLDRETRKKMMVMGVLPKTEVRVIRRAPLGDPLQVMVRGVSVAIRDQVASQIELECQS